MFESAELGRTVDKEAYEARVPSLREELLDAQFRVASSDFSVVIGIAGAEGAGKGETVNRLLEWLDARGIATHALGSPSEEESERPEALADVGPAELNWVAERLGGADTPANRERFAHGHAVMGVFGRGRGGVFTTGCTDWAFGLEDPAVSRITRNVIERFRRS